MKSLAARMKEKAKAFKAGKVKAAQEQDFSELPDGQYVGRLTSAEVGESKSSGRLQVTWQYKVLEGEYKGEVKFDFNGLEDDDQMSWLHKKLSRFNAECEDITELEEVLKGIVKENPVVKFRLMTKGEYQNLRILKVLDGEDAAETEEEETSTEAEDAGEEAEADEVEEEAEEETEEESSDEDTLELEIGSHVNFDFKGKQRAGKIHDASDDGETVDIIADDTKKLVKGVPIESLSAFEEVEEVEAEEEEEEVPEEPVKKKVSKVAPPPSKKKSIPVKKKGKK